MQQITKALTLDDLPAPPSGKVGWPWTEQSKPVGDRVVRCLTPPNWKGICWLVLPNLWVSIIFTF